MTFQTLNNTLPAPSRALSEAKGRITPDADTRAARLAAPFAATLAATFNDDASELDQAALREQQQHEQVRESAQQLVASAFVLPFLQQVRSETMRSDLFHGGFAEDAFGQQLDTHLADQFVQGGNFPLVDAVEQYMTQRGVPAAEALGREVNLHG